MPKSQGRECGTQENGTVSVQGVCKAWWNPSLGNGGFDSIGEWLHFFFLLLFFPFNYFKNKKKSSLDSLTSQLCSFSLSLFPILSFPPSQAKQSWSFSLPSLSRDGWTTCTG